VLFEEAREEARKLDAEFAETGKLKGQLHGVPITLKDMSAFPLLLFVRGAPRR
jgi:Asp-tRNA(Asn)/Glu-tRNA(Gln) amidotransferase A subunit family amidase